MNFKDLIRELRNGNRNAMRIVYDRYAPYMVSVCSRYLSSSEDTRDILHDCFIIIFRKIGETYISSEEEFYGWIRRIVANEALQYLRHKSKIEFINLSEINTDINDECDNLYELRFKELVKYIPKLSDRQRIVFNLFIYEHYSHKDIAKKLDISPAAAAMIYDRAKHSLIRMIKNNQDE